MGNLSPSSQSSAQDAKLLSAIEEANLERLQKAMRKGANIRSCVYAGLHPTRQSRIPTVSPPTPPLWSALMRAAYHGHNHIVQILLQQGVDIGLQAWDGTTALMLAAQEGHLHVVQELCKAVKHPILQPGLASKQIPPQTPPPQQLGAAEASAAGAMEESPQIVPRSASSFHPVLDAIDDKGQTALLRAAALGHGACMETLLIAGANVCIADRMDGMTALAWAAEHGPSRLVLLCIQAGSNINRKNHNGQTPLLCAASKDYDYSGDHQQLGVGVEDRPHLLSLDETRRLGSGESIEESKSMSHAVSSSSAGGGARFASSASPSSIVLTLLQNGGDANAANHDKVTALMVAAWKGHSAVVDLLIAHRANLNARAERGQTALMLAAAQAHSRCAETLITAGAMLDVVDEKGQTALHKAAVRGDTHTAECLVRAGADVRLAESVHGNTALQLAAQNLHSSIVELLLRPGRGNGNRADPCVRNHRGESALMLAAARGHSYTVACLLKGGAAPDLAAVDDAGNNSLMLAARAGSEPVVELLLDCASVVGPGLPALLAARNHADECALDLALQQRHAPVVELLIAAGSDAHLLVPSSNGSAGGQTATHIFSMLLQHASLKEAVDRGLAMRDRFETREKRYKDVVASLEQQQMRNQQDAAAAASSSSLDVIDLNLDHQNGGPHSPGGGRRQTPSGSSVRQANGAVDGSGMPTPIRSVSGDNPSAATPSARRTQPTLLTRHSSDLSNDSSSSPAAGGAGAPTSSAAAAAASAAIPSSISSRPILEWSVPQVLLWLQSLSLSSYTQSFSDAAIDGEMLLEFLRNEDLLESELGITRKIHRIKILREIKKMVPNSNGNGNGNTNGSTAAAAAPAAPEGTMNGSGSTARPSSNSVASESKDAAGHDHAAAAASVPLTTSISNPLPAPSGSVAVTNSNGGATTARFQQQQQQQQQPPSSASLFPAPHHTAAASSSPALSSNTAALFPAPASAASSSSAAAASPAAKPAPKILTSAATPSIFSAGFDFDNLAGLAPLSATSAASSGPSSNSSSAAPTPSGSGDKMPTMAEQPRIGGQQNSLSSSSSSSVNHQSPQPQLQPSASSQQQQQQAHHLQVHPRPTVIAQEYSPMHQTDLLMEPTVANGLTNGHAISTATTNGSSDDHSAADSFKATPAPSPSSSSSALRPHPHHHSPRRIPYSELVLKEIIGQGQFGTVWLGSWRGAAVAVKKLHLAASVLAVSAASGASGNSGASNSSKQLHSKDGSGSGGSSNIAAEQMALFLQEASLMELLGNHPNLISFVGISLPDTPAADGSSSASSSAVGPSALSSDEPTQGDVCIVTQYFPLGSIRDLLITKRTLSKIPPSVLAAAVAAGSGQTDQASAAPPSPLPLLTLLRMLRDISCGVLHLHLEHCIHRDLAARNFLVDEYSLSVRVADFGMSRFLQAAQQAAPNNVAANGGAASLHSAFTHSQVGPLKWMSPESILRHEYSSASDAYSWGIACWELVAQSEPYPDHLALEAAIRSAHEPSFRPVIPAYVPKPLAQLMQQCWAHAPKDRPTFAQILAQLERMEAHLKANLKSNPAVSPWSEACWSDYDAQTAAS